MPIHLKVNKDDYARTVLVVGDPARAELIQKLFKNPRLVNKNRGLLGYTGTYNGKPVSVQTTGIGCPSTSIVIEELIQCGVTRVIRVGTCGGIGEQVKALDYVAALSAAPEDGATRTYLNGEPVAPYATFTILKTAYDIAQKMKMPFHFGGVASVDVFYNPFPDYVARLRGKGILAVEMETSLIYYLANRSKIEAASFLLVSDVVGGGEGFTKYVTDEALRQGEDRLGKFVLDVCDNLPG